MRKLTAEPRVTACDSWLYDGYTMVIQWLYDGYTMVIQWLYNGYTMVIQWLYNGPKVQTGVKWDSKFTEAYTIFNLIPKQNQCYV